VSDDRASRQPSPVFLELYRLTVEMADRVSARRGTANSFFFTLHAALVAIIGFVRPMKSSTVDDASTTAAASPAVEQVDTFGLIYVAFAGLVLATAWWVLLKSYRDLNRAKFSVIGDMEKMLPAEPFNDEWEVLKADPVKKWRRRYAEFSTVERVVPVVFGAIYAAAIIRFSI
jgi:hypothetical protein